MEWKPIHLVDHNCKTIFVALLSVHNRRWINWKHQLQCWDPAIHRSLGILDSIKEYSIFVGILSYNYNS